MGVNQKKVHTILPCQITMWAFTGKIFSTKHCMHAILGAGVLQKGAQPWVDVVARGGVVLQLFISFH